MQISTGPRSNIRVLLSSLTESTSLTHIEYRYTINNMIKSFRCKDTQALFETGKTRRWASIAKVATRKLAQLDAAATLDFLKSPPGNHLESLEGDRQGQHSIRINKQWRLCFVWHEEGVFEVEITDYH